IVDLEPYYNADGITSDANPKDYIDFGGPFTYAAEFMPPPGPVKYLGITFAFPDGADGRRNVVRVKSQEIAVPEGNYAALAALVASLNGDKKTEIVAVYADGTREAVPLKVTDWCVAPKNKEFPVNISPHRHMPNGDLFDANPQILLVELPLRRDKTLQRLVLPKEMDLYFFALTLLEE
ncbi:MAG: hypothetical protein ACM3XS_04910, partial [Bacteroidota bacterium]